MAALWTEACLTFPSLDAMREGYELQRDWARQETAEGFAQILFGGDRPLARARSEPVGNGARAGR
jgi:hypothetical protein